MIKFDKKDRQQPLVRQRLDNIQALRGIAALMVLLLHGSYGIIPGNFGVDIFFCISGFIIVYTTQGETKDFLKKRLIRVVPLYWYATIQRFVLLWVCYYAGVANSDRRDLRCFVSSLLFLPINGAPMQTLGWTLYYEVAFYAMFAVACLAKFRMRSLLVLGEITLAVILAAILGINVLMLFELAGGMGAYYLIKRLYQMRTDRHTRLLFGFIAIISFATLFAIEKTVAIKFIPRTIRFGVPAFAFVVAFAKATQDLKMPKPLVYFGDVSFSLYLMQLDVFAVLKGAMIYLGIAPSLEMYSGQGFYIEKIVTTIIGVALTFALSFLTYNLIEKKLTGFLRKKLLRAQESV
ncbi:MAG: acyltransferase [Clostridiales bacterium]|jgi:peptidoglycan/LPS O-acetylase OafA/YrhL|nr:acyltransferase [Clostridiales bacterium]